MGITKVLRVIVTVKKLFLKIKGDEKKVMTKKMVERKKIRDVIKKIEKRKIRTVDIKKDLLHLMSLRILDRFVKFLMKKIVLKKKIIVEVKVIRILKLVGEDEEIVKKGKRKILDQIGETEIVAKIKK